MSIKKLELSWYDKDTELKVEPRILILNNELSYSKVVKKDLFDEDGYQQNDNMLIHGDNLIALKSLEGSFSNQVKCVYIDPPYNTGAAFEYYDDNLEHSIWLSLMQQRLISLRNLLREDGLIFVQIDDNEQAYLKVLMDEVFGRKNYINTIVVKAKAGAGASGGGEDKRLKKNYEFLLVYAKNYDRLDYNQPLNKVDLIEYIEDHKENNIGFYYTRVIVDYGQKTLVGTIIDGSGDDIKVYEHSGFVFSSINKLMREEGLSQKEIYSKYYEHIFMVTNAQTSILTRVNDYVSDQQKFVSFDYVPKTGKDKNKLITKYIWNKTLVVWLKDSAEKDENGNVFKLEKTGTLWDNLSWGRLDLEGGISFKSGKKPEALIQRVLEMATSPGDIVLDSFLGSGTTAAVAHKMGRKWIGVELGEHAYTLCKVRLDSIINGTDQSGISKTTGWSGGGGYKFYELAPTLIKIDLFGQPIINPEYNAEMLAIAVSKHEGYIFEPHDSVYWKQSKNGEKSFLFVTTKHISNESLDHIANSINDDEYLLIVCKSYDKGLDKFAKNINIKKIPQSLLKNCEYGVENYNLNIIDMSNFEYEDDSND